MKNCHVVASLALDRLRREARVVRAAFDLSYAHLDVEHGGLFRLLPLNPGPDVSTEAAAYLMGADQTQVEEFLQDLARAHLIEPGRVWGRWRMHDLVRLYADGHGGAHADMDGRVSARSRLYHHYQRTAEAADLCLDAALGIRSPRFSDRAAALAWLDDERDNLVATVTMARVLGSPAIAAELAFAFAQYLQYRRAFDAWLTVTTTALAVFRELGDRHGEGRALGNLGIALRQARRFEEAIDAHTQCLAVFRELGDRYGEGQALNNIGVALVFVRRFGEAIDAYTQNLTICDEVGDRRGESETLNNLGVALGEVRRFEEAIDAHARAVAGFREVGDRHGESEALNNLGVALRQVRRFDEAIDVLTQALTLFGETGDRHGEYKALLAKATAHNERRLSQEPAREGAPFDISAAAGPFG